MTDDDASKSPTPSATSPQAVESTLIRISDEVMQDAIARRERAARNPPQEIR